MFTLSTSSSVLASSSSRSFTSKRRCASSSKRASLRAVKMMMVRLFYLYLRSASLLCFFTIGRSSRAERCEREPATRNKNSPFLYNFSFTNTRSLRKRRFLKKRRKWGPPSRRRPVRSVSRNRRLPRRRNRKKL